MTRFYHSFLLLCSLLLCRAAFAQSCKVSIAEAHCLGTTLQAITDSTKRLDTLTWFKNNMPVQVTTSRSYGHTADTLTGFDIFSVSRTSDMALDDTGNIYLAQDCNVYKWKMNGSAWKKIAGNNSCTNNGAVQLANSVAVDSLGYVYVGEAMGRVSKWYNGTRVGLLSGLGTISKIRFDKNYALYILDQTNNAVYKLPYGATKYTLVAGGNGAGAALNQFNAPTCLAVDDDLAIYVGDPGNNRVTKWVAGAKTGMLAAGGGTNRGSIYDVHAKDIEVDAAHNLFILDGSTIVYWPASYSFGIKAGAIYPNETPAGVHMIMDKNRNVYQGLNGYVFRFPLVSFFDKTLATQPFTVSANYKVRSRYSGGCTAVSDSLTLTDRPYYPNINGQKGGTCGLTLPYSNYYYADDPTHPVSVWTVPEKSTLVSGQNTGAIEVRFEPGFTEGYIKTQVSNACETDTDLYYVMAVPTGGFVNGYKQVEANRKKVRYWISPREENSVYTWSVPPDATIAQGQGTDTIYVNFGTASGKITAITSNDCGSSTNYVLKVTVNSGISDKAGPAIISGVLPPDGIGSLKLFPQPAAGDATLSFTSGQSGTASLVVKDVWGKALSATNINVAAGPNLYHLPVAALRSGTYFVSIVSRYAPVLTVKMLVVK